MSTFAAGFVHRRLVAVVSALTTVTRQSQCHVLGGFMRHRIVCLLLMLAAGDVLAQTPTGTVRGTITDGVSQRPVPGARVSVEGTSLGAVSNTMGAYSIVNVPAGSQVLRATAIGYDVGRQTVTITAGQMLTTDFTMVRAATQLEVMSVTVTGYGQQTRRDVTGAIAEVPGEKLKNTATHDPMKALQGLVPGVEIVANSNEPGAAMQVRIRGIRSMASGRNEPLFVVDGIPINGGIEDFNPAIIDKISVLKDASATAIYGSRGANGVVLVTTKRGAPGGMQTTWSLDTYYGEQQPVQIIPMMTMNQFVTYLQDAARLNGQDTALAKVLQGQTFVPGTTTSKRMYAYQNGIETDWQRATLRD